MILKEITIKNFANYGNQEVVFNLENYNGITAIVGSNGCGKSSLVESVIWTLYGKNRFDNVDDIVNRYIGKDCKTSVTIEINNDEYKILRYRLHTTHKNNIYVFKNNEDISCRNASDTQQLILDIIRIPYIGFVNSTFFSTETYRPFLRSRNSERLVIFENLLNMHESNMIYDIARKHSNELKEQIIQQQNQINILQNTIDNTDATIFSYKENARDTILELKEKKDELTSKICEFKNRLDILQELNIDEEKKKIKDYNNKQEVLLKIESLKKGYKEIETLDKETIEKIDLFSKVDWQKEIKLFNELEKYKKQKEDLSNLLKEEIKQKSDYDKNIKVYNKELDDIEKNRKELNDKLKIILESICPTCKQHIDKEEVKKQEEEIKTYLIGFKTAENEIKEKQEKEVIKINDLNDNIILKQKELNEYENKIKVLEDNIIFSNPIEKQKECEIAYNKKQNLDKITFLIEESNNKIKQDIEELEVQVQEVVEPKFSIGQIENIDKEISDLNKNIENIKSNIDEINGKASTVYDKNYIISLENKNKKIKVEFNEIKEKIDEIIDDNKYYLFITDCFSNKGNSFKKYFIGEMIDVCNNKINQFLPFLFNEDINITFDKDLDETIVYNDKKVTFASLSTGQKARCELAIAFALFCLSRVFFSNDLNLLVVDEILDSALDLIGIRNALTILEGFANDTKVFVISHNPNIKESIENIIEIKQDTNGFSVLL